ncbi:hypothetical protein [Mesorhizobium sp. WSM4982]|uniref:hypothetical protein n=1 Tax=Mesorhizobium sp. WSM4982 TaxID=3038550 RepID=UPI002415860C|nr:hypothetical protein [Mesorhizobium sp. WSM4982]MDG4856408.1 hypothetical protein [Mesorhizobium sp. WSM4982]
MKTAAISVLLYLAIIIAVVYGWVANLIAVIQAAQHPGIEITTMLVLRVIGIPVPVLGAILGYF